MRPYQLSDELEKVPFPRPVVTVGAAAMEPALTTRTMAGMEFEIDGERLPLESTLTS